MIGIRRGAFEAVNQEFPQCLSVGVRCRRLDPAGFFGLGHEGLYGGGGHERGGRMPEVGLAAGLFHFLL